MFCLVLFKLILLLAARGTTDPTEASTMGDRHPPNLHGCPGPPRESQPHSGGIPWVFSPRCVLAPLGLQTESMPTLGRRGGGRSWVRSSTKSGISGASWLLTVFPDAHHFHGLWEKSPGYVGLGTPVQTPPPACFLKEKKKR